MAWTNLNQPFRKICSTVFYSPCFQRGSVPIRVLSYFKQFSSPPLKREIHAFIKSTLKLPKRQFGFDKTSNGFLMKLRQTTSRCNSHIVFQEGPVVVLARSFATSSRQFAAKAGGPSHDKANTTGLIYIIAIFILMVGGSYAAVPLYKVFCQVSGFGQAQKGHDTSKIEHMNKVDRQIRVRFNADVASSMRWNFRPQQTEVFVAPGETALAFYTAKNPTDKPIIGISTYNVLPFDAGQYFNKIQCFCFEEQRLNPNEQVDMPVFFFIDPDFAEDPKLENVHTITLSYTFFEAKEGLSLPLPGYPQPHDPKIPA